MTGKDGSALRASLWRWDQPVPLRWLLVDEFTVGGPAAAVAVCADIDGLFVDPPPPPPEERYTLLGCHPEGRLAAALDGTGEAWLGNIVLDSVHDPDRPRGIGCDPVPVGCCACMEQLLDLTVLGHRPSKLGSGRFDVELTGRLRREPRYTDRSTAQPPDAVGYLLTDHGGEQLGDCRDVDGVFRPRPEPPVHPVTLLGCQPEPPLAAALDVPHERVRDFGEGPLRPLVAGSILSVAEDGGATRTLTGGVYGSVTRIRRSALGDGLLDVVLDAGVTDPMPSGARRVWQRWWAGRPAEAGEWAGYDRELRHQWAGAALCHHRSGDPDQAPGGEYHLDGRHVTDVEGFYCAIGEAVNGPGGYFGWNGDALHDCLRGGWGAAWPFRLVWHDSKVAREYLVPGYDRRSLAPAVTMDDLLRWLAEDGVEVELR